MNKKIGLGIITYNAPEKIKQSAFSVSGVDEFVIVNDGKPYSSDCYPANAFIIQHSENAKVARTKNDALRYLLEKNCEHIFLMEDDIIIKDPKVFQKYIEASSCSGIRHLNFAYQGPYNFKHSEVNKKNKTGLLERTFDEKNAIPDPLLIINYNPETCIALHRACVGAFSYFHRSVIEKSGYFDEFFKNSWEHIEHTYRIIKDGFHPPFGWFADVSDSQNYLCNIENCMENSTIAKDPQWNVNSMAGEDYFKKKYGFGPTKIPPTSEKTLLKQLDKIYQSRDLNLLIKFPTRGRPEKFLMVLDMYIDMLHDKENYQIIISCDTDDVTMNNESMINKLKSYKNLKYYFNNNINKIAAVNGDMSDSDCFDIILLASDDMIPVVRGYDSIIKENMRKNFPDMNGVLWFNDGYQGKTLNTLCILGRKYFKEFNYIYHPEYQSLWCDNEFMHVANMLKKQKYIDQIIIRHEHPESNKSVKEDELYLRNLKYNSIDFKTYEKRKKGNFGLNKYKLFFERFKRSFLEKEMDFKISKPVNL
jgi:hypothetical protein